MASSRMVDALIAMLAHPHRRQLPERSHLRVRDGLQRMTEAEPASAFHLTEDQREPGRTRLGGDNVDLTEPTPPIPLQHLQALPLKFGASEVLPAYADLLLGFRRRHRPPPHGSMRTPWQIVRDHEICGNHSGRLWKPRLASDCAADIRGTIDAPLPR